MKFLALGTFHISQRFHLTGIPSHRKLTGQFSKHAVRGTIKTNVVVLTTLKLGKVFKKIPSEICGR